MAGLDGLFNERFHVGRNRHFLAILAGAHEGLAGQNVHNALEIDAFANGQDGRDDAVAIGGAQLIQHLAVINMLAIDLRHDDHTGHAALAARVPCFFKAGGQAGHSAHDKRSAFHSSQRARHLAREIEVAGDVDDIELLAVDFNGRHGRTDGDMALDLFRIPVADSVAIFDTALAIDDAGCVEHRLDQSGLALRAVSQYRDVANILYHVVLHISCASLQPPCSGDIVNDLTAGYTSSAAT